MDKKENLKEVPTEKKTLDPQAIIKSDLAPEKIAGGEGKDEYRVDVIRDYYGRVDPFTLSKTDPDFTYRFLRVDFKNLSIKTGNLLFQKGGWQIVPRAHLVDKLGIEERYIAPDGTYRIGDTVLARMPKKLWEEKLEYKKEQAAAPMKRVQRTLDHGLDVGKEIHPTMKGIQTKKDLRMK